MVQERSEKQFVVCVDNRGYQASLEPRKIYEVIPDKTASRRALIRVIDESGEDYLYPRKLFVPIDVPKSIEKSFSLAT